MDRKKQTVNKYTYCRIRSMYIYKFTIILIFLVFDNVLGLPMKPKLFVSSIFTMIILCT